MLDQPTRDGEQVIHILTNLPKTIKAKTVARVYRKRWTIETAFQQLEGHLHSEINTLGYPKAGNRSLPPLAYPKKYKTNGKAYDKIQSQERRLNFCPPDDGARQA